MANLDGVVVEVENLYDQVPFEVPDPFDTEGEGGMAIATLWNIGRSESFIPAYWSRARDAKLAQFIHVSDVLKVCINTFISKASTVPLRINARDRSIQSHVDLAEIMHNALTFNSGFRKGFNTEFKKFVYDFLTQDNGGFLLVLGPGRVTGPIVGRASGVVHLASHLCTRTTDPEYPVVYYHTDGQRYKIHYTRIIEMVNLPSSDPNLHGVGLCPVSLCVDAARELLDIAIYIQEKLGSRPQRQILYAKTGATVDQVINALRVTDIQLNNEGLHRFSKTTVLGPRVPSGKLELDKIDLTSAPDGFDRQRDTMLNLATIAAAFGLDLRDLAYSFGISGQTRSDAQVQHDKGLGKGVAEFLSEFSRKLDDHFLPPSLVSAYDYIDDTQDEKAAEIASKRSTARTRDIMGKVLTPRVARELMVRNGEITEQEFRELELSDGRLPDGSDTLSLIYINDPVYKTILGPVGKDFYSKDPEQGMDLVNGALQVAWEMLAGTSRTGERDKIRNSLAALEKLKLLYTEKQQQEMMEAQQAAQAVPGEQPSKKGKKLAAGDKNPAQGGKRAI